MIYIASPYSAPRGMTADRARELRQERYEAVRDFQASVFKFDPSICAISPIVLMHDLALVNDMPTHAEPYWLFNKALMDAAKHIMVLRIHGWQTSNGVLMEIDYANKMNYPITYADPHTYISLRAD